MGSDPRLNKQPAQRRRQVLWRKKAGVAERRGGTGLQEVRGAAPPAP